MAGWVTGRPNLMGSPVDPRHRHARRRARPARTRRRHPPDRSVGSGPRARGDDRATTSAAAPAPRSSCRRCSTTPTSRRRTPPAWNASASAARRCRSSSADAPRRSASRSSAPTGRRSTRRPPAASSTIPPTSATPPTDRCCPASRSGSSTRSASTCPSARPARSCRAGPTCASATPNPALNDAFDDDGWYHTGDIGMLDEHGCLTITDRVKDIIIRGGENLSAAEIENAISGVAGIAEVAVVAAPDARLGEHACAVVRMLPGADPIELADLLPHLEAAGLARQKWPEELRIVTDFPRTASGKVRKVDLRADLRSNAEPVGPRCRHRRGLPESRSSRAGVTQPPNTGRERMTKRRSRRSSAGLGRVAARRGRTRHRRAGAGVSRRSGHHPAPEHQRLPRPHQKDATTLQSNTAKFASTIEKQRLTDGAGARTRCLLGRRRPHRRLSVPIVHRPAISPRSTS